MPYTFLSEAKKELEGTNIKLGSQNMFYKNAGAYTGEISPIMLKELGVEYCILGHSERRQYFFESNELINKKVLAALDYQINPIICVGETLEEREENIEKEVVKKQINEAFKGVESASLEKIVVAYEPIWAIGTGKTASSDDANDMIAFIRESLGELYGSKKEVVRIQYGGSVKPENIKELMGKEEIDGALVGGASLKAEDFVNLINF